MVCFVEEAVLVERFIGITNHRTVFPLRKGDNYMCNNISVLYGLPFCKDLIHEILFVELAAATLI